MDADSVDAGALYDTLIVDRARRPRHSGTLSDATSEAQGSNPLCGDRVMLSVRVHEGHLSAIRHTTRGCAICAASADLMAESVEGRPRADALVMADHFDHMLSVADAQAQLHPAADGTSSSVLPQALRAFLPLKDHRSRLRCATLPWTALREALDHD